MINGSTSADKNPKTVTVYYEANKKFHNGLTKTEAKEKKLNIKIFNDIDSNKDGKLSAKEIKEANREDAIWGMAAGVCNMATGGLLTGVSAMAEGITFGVATIGVTGGIALSTTGSYQLGDAYDTWRRNK